MDFISALTGFLIGTATGAAGTYFADKYTDQRRDKQRAKDERAVWQDIERRFPAVIAEMREDFSAGVNRNVRAFFVMQKGEWLNDTSEECFEYHTDTHADLLVAVNHLLFCGFISELKRGSCPKYRMHEHFVDLLRGTKPV